MKGKVFCCVVPCRVVVEEVVVGKVETAVTREPRLPSLNSTRLDLDVCCTLNHRSTLTPTTP